MLTKFMPVPKALPLHPSVYPCDTKSLQSVGKWFAEKWAKLEQRYGRHAALGMAVAAIATMPVPFNVTAIIGVAETIRGIHGYATGKDLEESARYAPVWIKPVAEELKSLEQSHKKGCLMALIPPDFAKVITDYLLQDVLSCHLAKGGYSLHPHCTVLYGFTDSSPEVIEQVKSYVARHGPFTISLNGLNVFKGNEDGDVLHVVVDSPELEDLNRNLAEMFGVEQNHEYKPHLTLAYLLPDVAETYLKEPPSFANQEVRIEQMEFSTPEKEKEIIPLTYAAIFGTKDATVGKPKKPGFTGKDAIGREWVSGKLVPAKDKPPAQQAAPQQQSAAQPQQAAQQPAKPTEQKPATEQKPEEKPAPETNEVQPEAQTPPPSPEQVKTAVKDNNVSTYNFAPDQIEAEKSWQQEYANFLMKNVEAVPQQPPGVAARFISGLLNTALGGAGWLFKVVSKVAREVYDDPAIQNKLIAVKDYVASSLGYGIEDVKKDEKKTEQVDQTSKALLGLFAKALPLLEATLKELAAQKKATPGEKPKNEIPEVPKPETPEPIKHPEGKVLTAKEVPLPPDEIRYDASAMMDEVDKLNDKYGREWDQAKMTPEEIGIWDAAMAHHSVSQHIEAGPPIGYAERKKEREKQEQKQDNKVEQELSGKPEPPTPPKSELRHNPDLDEAFGKEPEKEKPSEKKPIRHNELLDEVFKRLLPTKFKAMSAMNTLTGGVLVPPPAQGKVIKLRRKYQVKRWVTLEPSGVHVDIEGGEIAKGPTTLEGKKPSELKTPKNKPSPTTTKPSQFAETPKPSPIEKKPEENEHYEEEFNEADVKNENKKLSEYSRPVLTKKEVSAVEDYCDEAYGQLNRELRGGKDLTETKSGIDLKSVHAGLQEAFKKTRPFKEPVPVSRMLNITIPSYLNDFVESMTSRKDSGETFQMRGYVSTTTSDLGSNAFDGNVKMKISARQGLDVKPYSINDHEDELLLDTNSSFVVKNITKTVDKKGKDFYEIEMEQVLPDQKKG